MVNSYHWCGFLADIKKRRFIYIDAFGNQDKDEAIQALAAWGQLAESRSLILDWQIHEIDFTKQKSNDTHNCGVYIAKYLKLLNASNENLIISNTDKAMLQYRADKSADLKTKLV